jgi:hypothetical protein
VPVYPGKHVHVNASTWVTHVAPLTHGLLEHRLTSAENIATHFQAFLHASTCTRVNLYTNVYALIRISGHKTSCRFVRSNLRSEAYKLSAHGICTSKSALQCKLTDFTQKPKEVCQTVALITIDTVDTCSTVDTWRTCTLVDVYKLCNVNEAFQSNITSLTACVQWHKQASKQRF